MLLCINFLQGSASDALCPQLGGTYYCTHVQSRHRPTGVNAATIASCVHCFVPLKHRFELFRQKARKNSSIACMHTYTHAAPDFAIYPFKSFGTGTAVCVCTAVLNPQFLARKENVTHGSPSITAGTTLRVPRISWTCDQCASLHGTFSGLRVIAFPLSGDPYVPRSK